ncbi:MAG: MoxR family ATPase [Thermoplasmataceae archaeon]|jgi:MoxR-like ATPase
MEIMETGDLKSFRDTIYTIQRSIGRKVIGSERIVRFMFVALLSDNHVLLEGVPGLAKTMLASEFAANLGLVFKRIQFTPDMLPSDVTGGIVFNLETRKMEFRKGPIFGNILLADELNRTPPKVHSALLEGMEEKHVSTGGITENLPEPFFVIATQNPIEQEGTFPLAEALMDRFLFRYILTYPSREEEIDILKSQNIESDRNSELTPEKIINIRKKVNSVYVSDEIMNYVVDIIRKSRTHNMVYIGASPRTTAKYLKAARANALINGRDYVIPEDIKTMSHELLNHRLILNPEAMVSAGNNITEEVNKIIDSILADVEAPQ